MPKILIVDDDVRLCETLGAWLSDRAFVVDMAYDGFEGSEFLKSSTYDLVVLDVTMPGKDGFELLQEYRADGGAARVLMLTGKGAVEDVERGFNAGADDYLRKPFHGKEFVARVSALLRRPAEMTDTEIKIGDLALDKSKFSVTRSGTPVQLLPREFALLEFFMRNAGQIFSAETLLMRVWKADSEATTEAVTSCIKRLRQKLDDVEGSSLIRTIRGAGYIFEKPNNSAKKS